MSRTGSAPGRPIRLNGRPHRSGAGSVRELLDELGYLEQSRGIAVAVNGEIVPRRQWPDRSLEPGDEIDVVGAVQGG